MVLGTLVAPTPTLIFGRVPLEQAPVRSYSGKIANHRRILIVAICEPNFNNAKILFGRYRDSVHVRKQRLRV